MKPIVTVTLNPAVDLTIALDSLLPGEVNRAVRGQSNAGGKGVNVAGCAADWGAAVTATGVLGRGNDGVFAEFFAEKGIADRFVRIAGDTRTNIKIADMGAGTTTDVNMPGLVLDAGTYQRVIGACLSSLAPGAVVVLGGSLPAGLPADAWCPLTAVLHGAGAKVIVDTSGEALAAVLAAEGDRLPDVVKPNRHELEDWAGRPLAGEADLVATARRLTARGIGLVVVSLGADGALFVTADAALSARLPPVQALSTVGAGDAMVAGLATALAAGLDLEDTARRAVAFAAAKLGRIGPHLPPPDVVLTLAEKAETARLAA